jgi:hypothetical protein
MRHITHGFVVAALALVLIVSSPVRPDTTNSNKHFQSHFIGD